MIRRIDRSHGIDNVPLCIYANDRGTVAVKYMNPVEQNIVCLVP